MSGDTVHLFGRGIGSLTKVSCMECDKPQHPWNRLWSGATGSVEWYTCDDDDDDDDDDDNNNNDDDNNDNS